jgi:ankyrin repeat protein
MRYVKKTPSYFFTTEKQALLHVAVQNGDAYAARRFVKMGADVKQLNAVNEPPVHHLLTELHSRRFFPYFNNAHRYRKAAAVLKALGTNRDALNAEAGKVVNATAAEILLDHANSLLKGHKAGRIDERAIFMGELGFMKMLIRAGFNLNQQPSSMDILVENGCNVPRCYEMADLLVKHGGAITLRDKTGNTFGEMKKYGNRMCSCRVGERPHRP